MKKIWLSHLLAGCLLLGACQSEKKEVTTPDPVFPIPTEAQLAWHEMEMNAFIHFTTNTFTDKEWGYGDEKPTVFNPSDLDVEQWITTLRDAGFKGVILTTKHHDGFCLWPSEFTEHSIKNSPFDSGNGDIVKAVSEACKKYGLKFGVYLSPWDRNRADYGTASYIEYYRNQLKELFTNYGPVFEMWFDGANGGDGYYGGAKETRTIDRQTYYNWPETLDMVRKMQPEPQVLFFSDGGPDIRWVGNEKGWVSETNWNTINNDTLYAGKSGIENLLSTGAEDGTKWIPAEVDVSIRPGWFYHAAEDTLVKSSEKLFEIYLTSVGRGSNLLLNIPPDRRGKIHDKDIAVLKDWKALRDSAFHQNLTRFCKITASSYRGNSETYAPEKTMDQDKESYWATDDDQVSGQIDLEFDTEREVKYVEIQEYIKLGQRVKAFSVALKHANGEVTEIKGTTIGYKRILAFQPQKVVKVSIRIEDAKACPLITNIAIY